MSSSWTDVDGSTEYIGPSIFLGYGAGAFAFLMSFIGALENAGQTIYWVEDAIDDWLKGYGKDKYAEILKDADASEAMQTFLVEFTMALIAWTTTSMMHSAFLVMMGFISAYLIFADMVAESQEADDDGDDPADVNINLGYKAALFGAVIGGINFMAGTVTKGITEQVMLMLGFTDHVGVDPEVEIITTTTTTNTGITSETTTPTQYEVVAYDYEALLKL
jgi:hypothetical protein